MCGRFVVARATSELLPLFQISESGDGLPGPSFNIAPSQRIDVVVERTNAETGQSVRALEAARWGLVARFKKAINDGPVPFNARVEKLLSSAMYRQPFLKRRTIIPADGFYERRKADSSSFFITPRDGSMLGFAGIYEWWRDPEKADNDPTRWLLSTTIITHPAQGPMTAIHDREPLYLDPDLWAEWLDPGTLGDAALLGAAESRSTAIAERLEYRPIGHGWLPTTPGKRQDSPDLIAEISS
jgi:putative SOS response-associated peptidase YedK